MDITTPDPTILEKLRSYCPAFVSVDDTVLWTNFVNTWNLFMSLLCWGDSECNSLLEGERVIFEEINRDCCDNVEIYLKHSPIVSVDEGILSIYVCNEIEQHTIDNISNNLLDGTNELYIHLTLEQRRRIHNCSRAILKITYTAGYSEIPECLYSAICLAIGNAIVRRNGITDTCDALELQAVNARLKRREIDGETWDWVTPNDLLQNTLDGLESGGILSTLGEYSNCINKLNFST